MKNIKKFFLLGLATLTLASGVGLLFGPKASAQAIYPYGGYRYGLGGLFSTNRLFYPGSGYGYGSGWNRLGDLFVLNRLFNPGYGLFY